MSAKDKKRKVSPTKGIDPERDNDTVPGFEDIDDPNTKWSAGGQGNL